MLIADRRWYEATPAAVIAAPALLIRSGAPSKSIPIPDISITSTSVGSPVRSWRCLVGESRLLGVVVAKPVPVECEPF